jgi:hypothetical protein
MTEVMFLAVSSCTDVTTSMFSAALEALPGRTINTAEHIKAAVM